MVSTATALSAVEVKPYEAGADSERASIAAASVFKDDLEEIARRRADALHEHDSAIQALEQNRTAHHSLAAALSRELEAIRHRVTTAGFASRMARSISWYAILFGVVILLGLLSDPSRWVTVLLGLAASGAGFSFLSRVRPRGSNANDGESIWQRDQLWWGLAFLSAGVAMIFRGVDGQVLIGPWLALATHLGFLVIPARRSISQYHDNHPATIARYVVRKGSVSEENDKGAKARWDALCLDEPGKFSYPAESWPQYGGARIVPGDALIHVCEKHGLPYIGYAHGKGFLDWPSDLEENSLSSGFTRSWANEAKVKTKALFEQISQIAADAIPVLNKKKQAAASIADTDSKAKQIDDGVAAWSGIHLPKDVARALIGSLDLFARGDPAAPRGILFRGPSGTGKSKAAEVIEKTWGNRFIRLDMATFRSSQAAATEAGARAYWKVLKETVKDGAAIIFIDHCEAMFPAPGDARADAFTKTISENFLRGWDESRNPTGPRFLVLASTSERDAVDPAFLGRFDCIVAFPPPSAAARSGIISEVFRDLHIDLPVTPAMVDATRGFTGGDLRTAATEARRATQIDGRDLTEEDFLESARGVRGKTAPAINPQSSWANLVISDALRDSLQTMMEMLRNAAVLAKQGIAVPRSILLQGPPGTGKTEIARVLAAEAGMNFKAYSTAQLKGQYLGHTAANVKKVFETARASSPAIVYLDEIDIVAGSRGGGRDDRFTDEFLGQILQEMDGITHHDESVFVIASTNSPETLDDALKSRFEETITVDLPDESARLAILKVRLKGKPLADNLDSALHEIATRSSGWSGRDIKNLVASGERGATSRARKEGKMDAVQITAQDLMTSFEKILSGSKP